MSKKKWYKLLGITLAVTMLTTCIPQSTLIAMAGENNADAAQLLELNSVSENDAEETEEAKEAETEIVQENFSENIFIAPTMASSTISVEACDATASLVIRDATGLIAFAESVANGNTYTGKIVKLGANIVFDKTTESNFSPIGTRNSAFNGTFDGAGYTISGIVMKEDAVHMRYGLFAQTGNLAVVKNLTLSDCEFVVAAREMVGGIVGYNAGTLHNCIIKDSTVALKIGHGLGYSTFGGGVAAYNYGTIDTCRILNSTVEGKGTYVGGITGSNYNGHIKNCIAEADVSGDVYAAGICGIVSNSTIKNSAHVGEVSVLYSTGYVSYVGGIFATAHGSSEIKNCYHAGLVSKDSTEYAGGVGAYCADSTIVSNCYYSNHASSDIYLSVSSVQPKNLGVMVLSDMQSATFADRLNTYSGAEGDWLPWTIRSGLDYPQHIAIYLIEAESSYGTININQFYAKAGEKVKFSVTPDTYYKVSSVSVKTTKGNTVKVSSSNGSYSFTMPADSVEINVNFKYEKPIGETSISLSRTSYTYDGKAKKPTVAIKDGMKTLVLNTDYTYKYSANTNAGTGKVVITGKGNYSGTKTMTFTIKKVAQKLSVKKTSYSKTYGNVAFSLGAKTTQGPKKITYKSSDTSVVTVNAKGKVTIKGPGYAKVTVTAPGTKNYKKETKTVTITVKPKKQKVKSVVKKGSLSLQVTWRKDTKVSGYQVQYSKDQKTWKSVYVNNKKTNSAVVANLVENTNYYIRVRSFVKSNGKKYYGAYSDVMKSSKVTK